ncbi:MAG: hypothetical protein ABR598_02875 [Candidatus Dormibacteria bacterium]
MPFPAVSAAESVAIGLTLGAIGFGIQESLLRRRARARAAKLQPAATPRPSTGVRAGQRVTTAPAAAPAGSPARPTGKPGARRARNAAATVQQPAHEPRAKRAVKTTTAEAAAAKPATVRVAPRPARTTPVAAVVKRHAALNRGLDAVIEFVDGPARRGEATACADALLLAVPKGERGPELSRFLRAAGAKESPGRLQEIAEDAAVELAVAIKTLAAEIKSRSKP